MAQFLLNTQSNSLQKLVLQKSQSGSLNELLYSQVCAFRSSFLLYTELNQSLSTIPFGNITSVATQSSVPVKGKYLIDEDFRHQ